MGKCDLKIEITNIIQVLSSKSILSVV